MHICVPHQQQGHPQMSWWSICCCQLQVYIAQNFVTIAVQLFSRHAVCVCLTGLSPWICLWARTKLTGACSLVRKELRSAMSVVCQRWKLRLLLINYWLLVESAPDWYCSVVLDICRRCSCTRYWVAYSPICMRNCQSQRKRAFAF